MTRRRGMTLMHMISILPLLAAVIAVGFKLSSQALTLQSQENHQISTDARLREMVRRIRRDVGSADSAVVKEFGDGMQLELDNANGKVIYKVDGVGVTRIERLNSESEKASSWTMESVYMDFQIEEIASQPGIVWITFERKLKREGLPDQVRTISAAATIGRGGAS